MTSSCVPSIFNLTDFEQSISQLERRIQALEDNSGNEIRRLSEEQKKVESEVQRLREGKGSSAGGNEREYRTMAFDERKY